MCFIVTRRDDFRPEELATRELRRVPHLAAARRVGYEIAYRFLESKAVLDRPVAVKLVSDVLAWNGQEPIVCTIAGSRFTLASQ